MNRQNNLSAYDLLKSSYQPSIREQQFFLKPKVKPNENINPNTGINLYDTLKYSYKPLNKQEEFYKRQGYELDKDLSNDNQQVLFNKDSNKLLYNIAGTHKLSDWATDANLLLGNIKGTNRYKEADDRLRQAKQKYNVDNATITGHSLGGTLGSYIASPNDKAFLLDEGATFGQKVRNNPNHQHYRTNGDLVSSLNASMPNMTTLSNKNKFKIDPISTHDIEHIKNEGIFV